MKENNFSPVIGHHNNIAFLKKLLQLDSQGQAVTTSSYIFAGPAQVGKKTTLFWFLQSLLCQKLGADGRPCDDCSGCQQLKNGTWPDLHIVKRLEGKKNVSIDQVKELIQKLSMSAFLDGYKVGIIYESESLSIKAANALLKQLEEPNSRVLIFLLVNNTQDLPQTIVSRSQVLSFNPVKADLIYDHLINERKLKRSQSRNISQLSAGRPGLALELSNDQETYDMYLQVAKQFIGVFKQDINARLQVVEDLMGRASGQTAVAKALGIVDIWQNVTRDILIHGQGENDLIQHQALLDDLAVVSQRQSVKNLIAINGLLQQARQYLRANVNPKLALEQVIISI